MTPEQKQQRINEIRQAVESFTPASTGSALMHDYAKELLSLVESQPAGSLTPFCPVHKELEKRDGLVLEVGNDCVACSLHERTMILNMLEPFAATDGSQDSLTVLRRVIDGDSMRSRCVDVIKSLRSTPHGAAYNNALNDAIHKVESLSIREVNSRET